MIPIASKYLGRGSKRARVDSHSLTVLLCKTNVSRKGYRYRNLARRRSVSRFPGPCVAGSNPARPAINFLEISRNMESSIRYTSLLQLPLQSRRERSGQEERKRRGFGLPS